MRSSLITEAYRAQQKELHEKGNYGTASLSYGPQVSSLLNELGSKTLLDYGCGSRRSLLGVLDVDHDVRYQGYDPAIEGMQNKEPAELVVCIDVLEHIEPDLLDHVLDDLQSLTQKWAFFTIHTGPAGKVLSDGRNAHLIQKPAAWWLPQIMSRWDLWDFSATAQGFNVLLRAK